MTRPDFNLADLIIELAFLLMSEKLNRSNWTKLDNFRDTSMADVAMKVKTMMMIMMRWS